jgi:hypothetical protein
MGIDRKINSLEELLVDHETHVKIDRGALFTILITLALQTAGAIWWAATISGDVKKIAEITASDTKRVSEQLSQIRAESYTRTEASLQIQYRDSSLSELRQRLGTLEASLRHR